MHTNVRTDLEVARSAGYDGVELWMPKLIRYLDVGFSATELADALGSLRVTMIDVLLSIERTDAAFRRRLLSDCERISSAAEKLGCGTLQVVALDDFDAEDWPSQRRTLIASLRELAEIAGPHDVRLGLEPVTFSPFHSISQALEVIDAVGAERVGLVLDTWHLWTSGVPWEHVAGVDPSLVACAHISDTKPKAGPQWRDEDRTVLPGDGILPLNEGIAAIHDTGYDGVWSVEMFSEQHWEWEPNTLARELLNRTRALLTPARGRSAGESPAAARVK